MISAMAFFLKYCNAVFLEDSELKRLVRLKVETMNEFRVKF